MLRQMLDSRIHFPGSDRPLLRRFFNGTGRRTMETSWRLAHIRSNSRVETVAHDREQPGFEATSRLELLDVGYSSGKGLLNQIVCI